MVSAMAPDWFEGLHGPEDRRDVREPDRSRCGKRARALIEEAEPGRGSRRSTKQRWRCTSPRAGSRRCWRPGPWWRTRCSWLHRGAVGPQNRVIGGAGRRRITERRELAAVRLADRGHEVGLRVVAELVALRRRQRAERPAAADARDRASARASPVPVVPPILPAVPVVPPVLPAVPPPLPAVPVVPPPPSLQPAAAIVEPNQDKCACEFDQPSPHGTPTVVCRSRDLLPRKLTNASARRFVHGEGRDGARTEIGPSAGRSSAAEHFAAVDPHFRRFRVSQMISCLFQGRSAAVAASLLFLTR